MQIPKLQITGRILPKSGAALPQQLSKKLHVMR